MGTIMNPAITTDRMVYRMLSRYFLLYLSPSQPKMSVPAKLVTPITLMAVPRSQSGMPWTDK